MAGAVAFGVMFAFMLGTKLLFDDQHAALLLLLEHSQHVSHGGCAHDTQRIEQRELIFHTFQIFGFMTGCLNPVLYGMLNTSFHDVYAEWWLKLRASLAATPRQFHGKNATRGAAADDKDRCFAVFRHFLLPCTFHRGPGRAWLD